jgi:hypothetical protein
MSILLLEGGGSLLLQGGGSLLLHEEASDAVPLLFKIDFNADSDFGDTGEDVTDRVLLRVGAAWSRGKDQVRQFAPAAAGQLAFVLTNVSRDYSPGNASSPLYGLVQPGRKVQIQTNGSAGEGFDFVDGSDFDFVDGSSFESTGLPGRVVWTGITYDIIQNPAIGERSVGFSCFGDLSRLRGKTISTALFQDIKTSDFLEAVLDEAGWPADKRNIQTGLTTLSQAWVDNEDAFDVIERVRATEGPGASIYEDRDGFIVFENRDARTTQTRSTVSQATFTHTAEITALTYNPNFNDTIDAAVIQVDERQQQGQSVLWDLNGGLTLTSGQVRRFQIRASSGDPFTNAVSPSSTPNDTVQTATASEALTAGEFKLRFREETTASPLNWNSTAAEWETALEGLSTIGPGNVSCAGGPISTDPIRITFIGVFAGQPVTELIEPVEMVLNPVSAPASVEVYSIIDGNGIITEKQGIRASSILTAGSYFIDFDGINSSTINYNDNAAAVQAAVSSVYVGATVTGTALSLAGGNFQMNLGVTTDEPLGTPVELTSITAQVGTASVSIGVSTLGGVADYVLTAGSVTFALSRTSGASAQLTVTAGGTGATLTSLRVRGELVTVARSHQVSFPEDTTDIPAGKIARPNVKPEISLENARQFVEMFVERRRVPIPTVTFQTITSLYASGNDSLYQRDVSDRITIIEAQTGISNDFHIEQIRQSVIGLSLVTEFGCEQATAPPGEMLIWYS